MEESVAPGVEVRPLGSAEEARACARMMSSSEPWITLKRGYLESLAILEDRSREVHVALEREEILGFLILNMSGAFAGYIQTVCVSPESRGRGVGTRLMEFAEDRIFRESPNVFLCVSDFNDRARHLYEKRGYERIGELKGYIVPEHSEVIYRKTIGPLRGFRKPAP